MRWTRRGSTNYLTRDEIERKGLQTFEEIRQLVETKDFSRGDVNFFLRGIYERFYVYQAGDLYMVDKLFPFLDLKKPYAYLCGLYKEEITELKDILEERFGTELREELEAERKAKQEAERLKAEREALSKPKQLTREEKLRQVMYDARSRVIEREKRDQLVEQLCEELRELSLKEDGRTPEEAEQLVDYFRMVADGIIRREENKS